MVTFFILSAVLGTSFVGSFIFLSFKNKKTTKTINSLNDSVNAMLKVQTSHKNLTTAFSQLDEQIKVAKSVNERPVPPEEFKVVQEAISKATKENSSLQKVESEWLQKTAGIRERIRQEEARLARIEAERRRKEEEEEAERARKRRKKQQEEDDERRRRNSSSSYGSSGGWSSGGGSSDSGYSGGGGDSSGGGSDGSY